MFSTVRFLAVAATSLSLTSSSTASPWNVDPAHTRIGFSIRHFFTPVQGQFDDFTVSLLWDRAQPANSRVEARVSVASVNTANARRDEHLKSADFFDAARFPDLRFVSTAFRAAGKDRFVATGDLTIRNVTRRIEIPVRLLGVQEIPEEMRAMMGGALRIASFEATLTLDRGDFGVGSGSWAETAVVGSDVQIQLQVEAAER